MKKIVYVSNEWFVDTDITVLAELSHLYTIHWLYYTNFSSPRFNIDELKQYATRYGIILHLYECHSKQLSWNLFKLQWRFIQEIRKINPDIVLRVSFHYYWAFLSILLRKYKIIYAFHDVVSHSNTKEGLLDDLCRYYIVKTNKYFILYSSTQYNYFNNKWPGKIVKNVGMSVKSCGSSEKHPSHIAEGVKLLFFGRIEYYKGLDLMIAAIERLYEKGISNIQLSVYGKGPFWNSCESLVKTKNLYNLNIRFVNTLEIPDLFSTHHFLVLPYRDATQSGPLMIAANYGMPIFAARLEGFLQIYPETCGNYYEVRELDDALLKLSKMTDQEYDNLRKNVVKLSELYSPSAIAQNYIQFFENII